MIGTHWHYRYHNCLNHLYRYGYAVPRFLVHCLRAPFDPNFSGSPVWVFVGLSASPLLLVMSCVSVMSVLPFIGLCKLGQALNERAYPTRARSFNDFIDGLNAQPLPSPPKRPSSDDLLGRAAATSPLLFFAPFTQSLDSIAEDHPTRQGPSSPVGFREEANPRPAGRCF